MIMRIQAHFSGSQFTKVLGDIYPGASSGGISPVGGDIVEQALVSLGESHLLESFGAFFGPTGFEQYDHQRPSEEHLTDAFMHCFQTRDIHRLKPAFCSIRGIKRLDCEEMEGHHHEQIFAGGGLLQGRNFMVDARAGLKEVKALMESPRKLHAPQLDAAPVLISANYVDQVSRMSDEGQLLYPHYLHPRDVVYPRFEQRLGRYVKRKNHGTLKLHSKSIAPVQANEVALNGGCCSGSSHPKLRTMQSLTVRECLHCQSRDRQSG